jgi:methylmalonyl-CoA mutase
MSDEGSTTLFDGFPDISTKVWEEKIKVDLKGADFFRKLFTETDEGIMVKPFYRKEDLAELGYLDTLHALRHEGSAPNSWTICQDIWPVKDIAETNGRIRMALRGGAQAIRIQLAAAPHPGKDMLGRLLEGIPLEETGILFQGYLGADRLYNNLLNVMHRRSMDASVLKGSLGADPLVKMVSTGIPIVFTRNLGELVRKSKERSPGFRVIDVDGSLFQDAGATLVEELAFAMAMASEYLFILGTQGIDPAESVRSMQLSLACGPNYFMEIAKLRAARVLWSRICKGYGINENQSRIHIHATTSRWNMSLYDPHSNMLRGTTQAMSAILGGADLVSVLPYDLPYGSSTSFSDRIARSVQVILRDEAYFERVADPAAGSYYVEHLTDSIAREAWELFREIESGGGFRKAIEAGWIQEKVLASRKKKTERFQSGRDHLLGTNAFPDFQERILDRLQAEEVLPSAESSLIPLLPFRIASGFEELRLETEGNARRPRVFLFKYGNPGWRRARAAFAGNFFACAGYEILEPPGFEDMASGIRAAGESGADLVVLCSADETYPALAREVLDVLGGTAIPVIAGAPGDSMEELKLLGIKHFIHVKSDLLETLRQFNSILIKQA